MKDLIRRRFIKQAVKLVCRQSEEPKSCRTNHRPVLASRSNAGWDTMMLATQLGCQRLGKFLIVALIFQIHVLCAFPPAPHHLIKGTVRNEMGHPLTQGSGVVILETASGIQLSTDIRSGLAEGMSYELRVPMDAGIHPFPYSKSALFSGVPFKMRVNIGGVNYFPIEMLGDFSSLGLAGETSVIHLTLGEDADGDGLPDAWERAMLQALGLEGLQDIDPEADSDGDGLSNLAEYISGNYAFDKSDGLAAKITGFHQGDPVVEFTAIRGRTYTLYESSDLTQWIPVSFYLLEDVDGGEERLLRRYQSQSLRVLQVGIQSSESSGVPRYFRIQVQ